MFGIIGGMNFFAGNRIYQILIFLFPSINRHFFILVYTFFALSFLFGRGLAPLPPVPRAVFNWIGAHWMGLMIYLFMFFLLADIIILTGNLIKLIQATISSTTEEGAR